MLHLPTLNAAARADAEPHHARQPGMAAAPPLPIPVPKPASTKWWSSSPAPHPPPAGLGSSAASFTNHELDGKHGSCSNLGPSTAQQQQQQQHPTSPCCPALPQPPWISHPTCLRSPFLHPHPPPAGRSSPGPLPPSHPTLSPAASEPPAASSGAMLTSSSQGPRRGPGAELPAVRCSLPGLSPAPVSAQPGAMVSGAAAGGQQAVKHAGGLLKPGQRGSVALPYSLSTGVLDGGWPGHPQAAAHIRPLARQGGEGLGAGRQGSLGAPLGVSAVGYNQVGAAALACLRLAQDAGGVSLPALWPTQCLGKDQLSGQQGSKGEGAGEVGLAPHPCHPAPLLAPQPTAMKQQGRQRRAEQQAQQQQAQQGQQQQQQQQGRQRQVPAAAQAVAQHDSQLTASAESAAAREGQGFYCGLSQAVLPDPNASQPLGSSSSRPPTPTPQRHHSQAGPGEACSASQSLPASQQPARSPQPMQPQPPLRPAPQAPREGLPGAPGPGTGLGAAAPPKQFMRGAPAVRRRLQAGSMFNTGDAEVKTALADALDAIQDVSVQASLKLQAQLPRAAPEEVLAHAIQVSLQQKQIYMHSMQALRMDVVKREQRQRTRY